MHISQEYRSVADGSLSYDITTFRAMNDASHSEMPHVILANGWMAGTPLYHRLARHLIGAANGNLAVTTYEDPLVGSSAYGTAYKADRLASSARAVAWDRPVTVVGHSRGWLTTALAGEQLVKEQLVGSLAGYTPMGLGESQDFNLRRSLKMLGSEVVRSGAAVSNIGSVATVGLLTARAFAHAGLAPVQAYREICDILCADESDTTAVLSGMVPTVMISGKYDTVVAPDCLQRRLDATGYQGSHITVPVSHVGAVVDYDHMPEVYGALQKVLQQPTNLADSL